MEKLDVLYDHYKETVHISLDTQKKRGTLFVIFCVLELLNFSMLLFPSEIAESISQYIYSTYEVTFNFNISLLQSAIWIVLSYTMIRYYQTNIYIERQYGYIALLEDKISKILHEKCFKRESDNYLDKYPKVLDLISIFYTWIIPALIIVVNVAKSIFEWRNLVNIWGVVFDTVCCAFCVILTVMYLIMMHPRHTN